MEQPRAQAAAQLLDNPQEARRTACLHDPSTALQHRLQAAAGAEPPGWTSPRCCTRNQSIRGELARGQGGARLSRPALPSTALRKQRAKSNTVKLYTGPVAQALASVVLPVPCKEWHAHCTHPSSPATWPGPQAPASSKTARAHRRSVRRQVCPNPATQPSGLCPCLCPCLCRRLTARLAAITALPAHSGTAGQRIMRSC